MSEAISIAFDNKLEDYVAADDLYYSSTKWPTIGKIVSVLLLACGLYLVIAVGIRWWTVIWFLLAVGEWFDLLSLRKVSLRFWYKRNPKFRDTYNLTFSENGIEFKTASIVSKLEWSLYRKYLENELLFILIYGSRAYTVIPKSALPDDILVKQLRDLFDGKIGKTLGH